MAGRVRRLLAVPALCALAVGCGPGPGPRHQQPAVATVSVDGRVVPMAGLGTVGAALTRTGTRIPTGRLLSVARRRPLGSDSEPGHLLVNGVPGDLERPLRPGDRILTVRGPDALEAVRAVVEPVPASPVATLRVGSRAGRARVLRGEVSGEVVSRTLLARPVGGHLPSAGAVALTFDDGPDPRWTPQVLAALARAHAHATFCLIGREAARHPELVRAIVAGGHALCNHTWDHDEQLPHRSRARITDEMARAQAAITRASGGVAPRLFRAPGGAWSPEVEQTARDLGLTPLTWTVDPRDWALPGTAAVLAATLPRLRPGAVVLLHDGGGPREQTLAALDQLLLRLPALHLSLVLPQP
ncbi:MAG: polysaccharide deacetylase family protein [Nocardioidaceae bacterium]